MPQPIIEKLMRAALPAAAAFAAAPAFAHPGIALHAGFAGGLVHPLLGADHLLAALAVGVWAAQSRGHAVRVLPLAFPLMVMAGLILGIMGVGFPAIETGLAGSVLALGLLIAFAIRMPAWAGAVLVSLFGLAHGHAHGTGLPAGASAALYGAGLLASTALLHIAGLLGGHVMAQRVARCFGLGVAAAGVFLLASV